MKNLIICEKPSLAQNMVDGLKESFVKHDGYYESNSFIVTYVFGHLFELKSVEMYLPDYDSKKKYSWKLDNLPCYPNPFQFVLKDDSGVRKQYKIIKSFLDSKDIDTVYHLGDADREGEVIIRNLLEQADNKHQVLRIWTDDQMPESLYDAYKNAKPDSEYDDLANEGYARMFIDWLYGINLSRLATLKGGNSGVLRVGRCIMAIVRAVYNREMDIKYFVPRMYYGIASETEVNGKSLVLKSSLEFDKDRQDDAREMCNKYNGAKTVVSDVIKKEVKVKPGKPYSITALQNVMGKKYKITPEKTLEAAQSLYEQKILSYPRTNSSYYADGEKEKIESVLSELRGQGYKVELKSGERFFNNKYVESHGALRITKLCDLSKLKDTEAKVYNIVLSHMLADFCTEECICNESSIIFKVGDYEEIKINGKTIAKKGFLEYEPNESKDKILPDLKVGDVVPTNFKPKEKETAPPKRYTIETLNNYCENPFRDELKEETEDELFNAIASGLSIGTGATRAGLIKNAISAQYMSLKKDTYYLEERGQFVIETLDKLHISMDKFKTAEVGKILKQISNGTKTLKEGIDFAEEQITSYFNASTDVTITPLAGSSPNEIGKCPKCGSSVLEGKANFYCTNKECNFSLFKENKWWTMKKKTITKTYAKALLKNGKVLVKGLYSSQKNKTYDATVVMTVGDQYPSFSLEFENKK